VSGVVSATRMAETLPARVRTMPRTDSESSMMRHRSQQPLARMHRPE